MKRNVRNVSDSYLRKEGCELPFSPFPSGNADLSNKGHNGSTRHTRRQRPASWLRHVATTTFLDPVATCGLRPGRPNTWHGATITCISLAHPVPPLGRSPKQILTLRGGGVTFCAECGPGSCGPSAASVLEAAAQEVEDLTGASAPRERIQTKGAV